MPIRSHGWAKRRGSTLSLRPMMRSCCCAHWRPRFRRRRRPDLLRKTRHRSSHSSTVIGRAVIELSRGGPGTSGDPSALVEAVAQCPEIQSPASDADDNVVAESAFEHVGFAWEAAGALDDRRRLTHAGAWLLPRALTRAWRVDFDSG